MALDDDDSGGVLKDGRVAVVDCGARNYPSRRHPQSVKLSLREARFRVGYEFCERIKGTILVVDLNGLPRPPGMQKSHQYQEPQAPESSSPPPKAQNLSVSFQMQSIFRKHASSRRSNPNERGSEKTRSRCNEEGRAWPKNPNSMGKRDRDDYDDRNRDRDRDLDRGGSSRTKTGHGGSGTNGKSIGQWFEGKVSA